MNEEILNELREIKELLNELVHPPESVMMKQVREAIEKEKAEKANQTE